MKTILMVCIVVLAALMIAQVVFAEVPPPCPNCMAPTPGMVPLPVPVPTAQPTVCNPLGVCKRPGFGVWRPAPPPDVAAPTAIVVYPVAVSYPVVIYDVSPETGAMERR